MSIKVAAFVDRLLEVIDLWEVPVTATQLHLADPSVGKRTVIAALAYLADRGVLRKTVGHDATLYFPEALAKADPIQAMLTGDLDLTRFKPCRVTRHSMGDKK